MQDATEQLNAIVSGLDALANQIVGMIPDDRMFTEIWGWNQPAINRHDLAALIKRPAELIGQLPTKEVDDALFGRLAPVPAQIQWLVANSLPQLPGGNSFHVYATLKSFTDKLLEMLQPLVPGQLNLGEVERRNLLPAAQIKKLRGVERLIEALISDSSTLSSKISMINEAHATAEALPADTRMLREAQEEAFKVAKDMARNQAGAESSKNNIDQILSDSLVLKQSAEKMVENIAGALGAATTKSLGDEFGRRAEQLSKSVWWLGGLLAITLTVGGGITYFRIEHINDLLSKGDLNPNILWAHVVLAIASIAAPVWLAWLVTKQIGQRFRLSEDYAFKASIAKAYAGYSYEAARVDPEFQKQLYRTALKRIDEEPLRYVELDNHGSPLHELLGKRRVRNAVLDKLGLGEKEPKTDGVETAGPGKPTAE